MSATIRLATPDDAAQVLAIYAPYCFTPVSFELEPPQLEEMRRRMTDILVQYPFLVYEDAGQVIGYVYACAHRSRAAYLWSVDTSVYIHLDRRRQGLGKALYTALLRILVLQGYINAYAGVTLPNADSVGLHETMGFSLVGTYRRVGYKCGAWHDVAWYQLALQPHPLQPHPPLSLEDACHRPEWTSALDSGLSFLCSQG